MKFKSVNPISLIEKYGFKEILTSKDESFHGHQLGLYIGKKNKNTNKFEESQLDDNKNDFTKLQEIIDDKNIIILEDVKHQFDEHNELVPKIFYFVPYVPENHTSLLPTVTNNNIIGSCNAHWIGKIEIIFSLGDELQRYVTMPFKTHNICMLDIVSNAFDDEDELDNAFKNSDTKLAYNKEDDGYKLDFYDNCGQKCCEDEPFSLNDLKNAIASIRLIELQCIIDD